MIYCYYDKNGILREIINNESTRQGTSESRAIIKVYYELHNEITSMSATFKVGDYVAQTERFAIGVEESAVPYNSKINYKYFKDNTPYQFFDFEIPSDILEKGANDVSTNVSCTFTPYYEDNAWDKLGLLTFNLQASVLNIDYTLTTSQMDYLLAEISKFEFVKNNGVYGTIDGSVRDGENALSTYPNGCFVLQYVLNTSQLVPATQIKGIRFYRVVANKYSLLYSSVENTDLLLKLEQSDITKTYQINTLLNDVADLKNKFLNFVVRSELSDVAFSGNYNDLSNKPNIPTQLSELTNNVGFITNAVSDLVNYYKKDDTLTKDDILARFNAIKTIKFEIYASLDNITEPQTNIIYLVGTESPYDEYAYIEDIGFELIGSTDIDLSNYVQSDNTLNTDYVVLGNADKKVKTSSYKIETSSLNNNGIPTTNLVQTEIRKYHDIITINGDSGTITNVIDTAYRLIVDENLLVYRRIKNDNNAPIYHSQQVIDNEHIRDYYLVFNGRNYTRSYVENVSHSEFDSLVQNTPTEIIYNNETKVAQLTHDGQLIGEGAVIDLDGFTPYFDGSGLVLSDLEHADMDLATKQDKIESVKIVAPNTATSGTFTSAELQTLLKNKLNYVEFNNENFYPQDVETGEGYIVYSHVGQIGNETKIKNINLTIATGGWVLTETSLVSAPISIVNELPEANEENFEKGKIYTTGELLQYISKKLVDTPTFSQVSALLKAIGGAATAAVGTDIYIFGGRQTSSSYINKIYKYSTTTNAVVELPTTLPIAITNATAAAVGTDIYIIGGQTSYSPESYSNKIYKYSTIEGTITEMSATSTTIGNSSAAAVGTDIYIFGGKVYTYANQYYNLIRKYDTTTDTLTGMGTTLPTAVGRTSAAAVGTDIYIFGGEYYDKKSSHAIYKYSTTTNVVTTLSATISNGRGTSAAAVGTDIYIFGGYNSDDDTPTSSICKYDTTTDTLTTASFTLSSALCYISSVSIDSNIYVIGGIKGNSPSARIDKLSFGYTFQYKTIATQ